MWLPFKTIFDLQIAFQEVIDKAFDKRDELKSSELIRHKLGSIDLPDIENKIMSPQERMEYCGKVALNFKTVIEPEIKKMIKLQEEWMAEKSDGVQQFDIGRGTINGLLLVLEKFEKDYSDYIQYLEDEKNKGKFDKDKILGKLTENI